MSVDLRVNRISAISGHMHRLEGRRMRRGASGTPPGACLPNNAYAQRWRLYATDSYLSTATALNYIECTVRQTTKQIRNYIFGCPQLCAT